MIEFGVSRPLHRTKKKELGKRTYPELENLKKPNKNNGCSIVAIKKHCKTQHFQYFWIPDPSPDHEKPKKNNGFSMVAMKNHCKT